LGGIAMPDIFSGAGNGKAGVAQIAANRIKIRKLGVLQIEHPRFW
jgi:hypothetical protein